MSDHEWYRELLSRNERAAGRAAHHIAARGAVLPGPSGRQTKPGQGW
jgi:hypothetical protein